MKKIMIVDDEETIIKMYTLALDKYKVIGIKNPEEVLERTKLEKPDLIYLDIIMPKMNGLDVLTKLKSDRETAIIPIIVLTNLPKEASAEKALSLGADDYFVKVENDPQKIAERTDEFFKERK